jgi:hypothetical protein
MRYMCAAKELYGIREGTYATGSVAKCSRIGLRVEVETRTPHGDAAERGLNTRVAAAKSRIISIPYDTSGALLVASYSLFSPLHSLCWLSSCPSLLFFYTWSSTFPLVERADLHVSYSSPPCLGVKSHDRVSIETNRLA